MRKCWNWQTGHDHIVDRDVADSFFVAGIDVAVAFEQGRNLFDGEILIRHKCDSDYLHDGTVLRPDTTEGQFHRLGNKVQGYFI